jgi:molybdopterin-synthase adenylyltransferase
MIELRVQANEFESILPELLHSEVEGCAVLLTRHVAMRDGDSCLLARDIVVPNPDDYLKRGYLEAQLSHEFVAAITKRAARAGQGLVFVHSHPGSQPPQFSHIDQLGELELAEFLRRRLPNTHNLSLIVSEGGVVARTIGSDDYARVISIGARRRVLANGRALPSAPISDEYDRQVRAFGAGGQQQLQELHVAIIGLGGTGSIVAQQLAHLGVARFTLVDPDTVEPTNLNRLANASSRDL